jgi:hypothetical protein
MMAKLGEYRRRRRLNPRALPGKSPTRHTTTSSLCKSTQRTGCTTIPAWPSMAGSSPGSCPRDLHSAPPTSVWPCKRRIIRQTLQFRGQDLRGQPRRRNGDGVGSWHVRPVERHDADWSVHRKLAPVKRSRPQRGSAAAPTWLRAF